MSLGGKALRRPTLRVFAAVMVVTVAICAAAVLGIQYAVAGSPSSPSPVAGSGTESVDVVRSNRKLKTSTIYSDNDLVARASGFQAMHAPITLNCPGTGTCTFEAEVYGQVRSSTNGNDISFCTQVDGVYMDEPLCPFIDPIDADGSFHTRVSSQSDVGFAPGSHSVVTDVFSESGIDDSITKITYRVYKP